MAWATADEAFRMCGVGILKNHSAMSEAHFSEAMMYVMRCQHPESRMPVF